MLSSAADKSAKKLNSELIKAVNELIEDINTCREGIAEQAMELIHQKYFSTNTQYYILLIRFIYHSYILYQVADSENSM